MVQLARLAVAVLALEVMTEALAATRTFIRMFPALPLTIMNFTWAAAVAAARLTEQTAIMAVAQMALCLLLVHTLVISLAVLAVTEQTAFLPRLHRQQLTVAAAMAVVVAAVAAALAL